MCIKPVETKSGHKVNCRKCPECVISRGNQWTFRINAAMEKYLNRGFYTFTYDDFSLPCGEEAPSLWYRDVQLFMKRLRKYYDHKIEYYIVGEYGEEYGRPHYHGIIGGVKPKDVAEEWKLGFVDKRPINDNRIKYVVKYMTKRLKSTPYGSEKPKAVASKGLGKEYVELHGKYHLRNNNIYYRTVGGNKLVLPSYIAKKIFPEEKYKELLEKHNQEMKKKK